MADSQKYTLLVGQVSDSHGWIYTWVDEMAVNHDFALEVPEVADRSQGSTLMVGEMADSMGSTLFSWVKWLTATDLLLGG